MIIQKEARCQFEWSREMGYKEGKEGAVRSDYEDGD